MSMPRRPSCVPSSRMIICRAVILATTLVFPSLASADDRPCGPDALPPALKALVPQGHHGADFRPACRNHDRCYGTPGTTKASCDRQFLDNLLSACESSKRPRSCKRRAAGCTSRSVSSAVARIAPPNDELRFVRHAPPCFVNQQGMPIPFSLAVIAIPGSQKNSADHRMQVLAALPAICTALELATRRGHLAACSSTLGDEFVKQVARSLSDLFNR